MAESPVLVVGGRTTGLMMAAELARHGIPVRIVDKSPGIDPHSRATFLHSRTLEIFHTLGIAHQATKDAQPLHKVSLYTNGRFVGQSIEEDVDSPFPRGVALSQAKTEKILEQHLNGFGVAVERSTQLNVMEQRVDGVRAAIQHADGREEIMETPWLIGCDGCHSTVRHLTKEAFPGTADPYPYMLGDVILDGPSLQPEDAHIYLHDEGDLFLFVLDEGRRLIVANVAKETDISKPPTLAQMQETVTRRSMAGYRLSDPRWLAYFHINYRLAPHYRHGRTFLAGDAAHIHSLLGGHGMNTGIQDAHNLAWKLALVMRGIVPEAWLDSYELERRRVAEDMISSTKLATEQSELFGSLSAKEQAKFAEHMFIPESEKAKARRHAEEIDLDYRSSHICVEPGLGFNPGPHAGSRAPDAEPIVVDGQTGSFFDHLASSNHQLLLFASAETAADTKLAAEACLKSHGHWIDTVVVRPPSLQLSLPATRVIDDPQRSLHDRFGADHTKLYLIRPDGYVAYRSRRFDSLDEYLSRVL